MDEHRKTKKSRPANGGSGRPPRLRTAAKNGYTEAYVEKQIEFWDGCGYGLRFSYRLAFWTPEGGLHPVLPPSRELAARPCHARVGLHLAERWAERRPGPDGDDASWTTPARLAAAWGTGTGGGLRGAVEFLRGLGWPIETGYRTLAGTWTAERPARGAWEPHQKNVGYRLTEPVEFERTGGRW